MNKYHQTILATTLIGLSSALIAQPLSYTFISAEYQIFSSEIDGISEDLEGDGLVFEGGFSIAPNFAILAGYATGSADVTSSGTTVDEDINIGMLGALFHTPINTTTDFVVGIRLLRAKVDLDVNGTFFESETHNGNDLFLGIRAMATEKVELNGFIERTKYKDADSSTDISFGLGYYVNPTVSLNAGYSFDNDGNTLSFGIAKYF